MNKTRTLLVSLMTCAFLALVGCDSSDPEPGPDNGSAENTSTVDGIDILTDEFVLLLYEMDQNDDPASVDGRELRKP